jgi:tetratricopeptide (TPR) repeat protein
LANLVSRAQSAKRNDRFLEAIAELKSLPATSFNDEGEVFQNVYFLEHLFYMNQGDFDKAEALVPAIEAGLDKYAQKINKARLLSFQFNIMIMYFLMHRFKEAAKWADVILEDKSEIKQGISMVTRILLPIIHFELGHHDIVENLTRSAYRYLLAKERLHSFERLMVNYLGEMPFSSDNVEFIDKLKTFNNKLKEIFESPEPLTYGMEEIGIWVKAKLHSDTMINVLKSTVSVPR